MATQDLAVQRLKPRGSKRKQGLLSERANASQIVHQVMDARHHTSLRRSVWMPALYGSVLTKRCRVPLSIHEEMIIGLKGVSGLIHNPTKGRM
jgi:hypothetical protein